MGNRISIPTFRSEDAKEFPEFQNQPGERGAGKGGRGRNRDRESESKRKWWSVWDLLVALFSEGESLEY